jgi:hypothetical protein
MEKHFAGAQKGRSELLTPHPDRRANRVCGVPTAQKGQSELLPPHPDRRANRVCGVPTAQPEE